MVLIISALVLNFTRAKYKYVDSMPLINGTVNYTPYDFKMVAMYQENEAGEYESIDTVPSSGYSLNLEESYCEVDNTKDNNITITYENGSITFGNVTKKGTKCYLYFDEQASIKDTILANYPTVLTKTDFSSTVTNTTSGTIYKSADSSQYDENGEVYYFAGNPTDNWVQFAGFYWRIIRINGDGTVRLIYQGKSTTATGTDAQVGNGKFNNVNIADNMYLGLKYTEGNAHGTDIESELLKFLNTWYKENIENTIYENSIDLNSGFCNDRTTYNGTGIGMTSTTYSAYNRLIINKKPTFICNDNLDLFTVIDSSKGNHSLSYPMGLITADEVAYAGGVWNMDNKGFYLYTGNEYWTITPHSFVFAPGSSYGVMFTVYLTGNYGYHNITGDYGIRPVINLKADTVFEAGGTGTSTNPYVVV